MAKNIDNNSIPEIVQIGDPVLETPAKEIPIGNIESPEVKDVIKKMILALESQEDGVGLAAPQIGISLRIFIVAGFVFDRIKLAEKRAKFLSENNNSFINNSKNSDDGNLEDGEEIEDGIIVESGIDNTSEKNSHPNTLASIKLSPEEKSSHQIFINPEIIGESKEKKWMDGEGCLSVRWLYGKVKRSTKVTLRAYNEHGQIVERGASGLLAHIFQHEVDHLNGILFIDKAKDIQEYDPEEIKKELRNSKSE